MVAMRMAAVTVIVIVLGTATTKRNIWKPAVSACGVEARSNLVGALGGRIVVALWLRSARR
jgi:hypothetical protein